MPPTPGTYLVMSNVYYYSEVSGEVPFGSDTIAVRERIFALSTKTRH